MVQPCTFPPKMLTTCKVDLGFPCLYEQAQSPFLFWTLCMSLCLSLSFIEVSFSAFSVLWDALPLLPVMQTLGCSPWQQFQDIPLQCHLSPLLSHVQTTWLYFLLFSLQCVWGQEQYLGFWTLTKSDTDGWGPPPSEARSDCQCSETLASVMPGCVEPCQCLCPVQLWEVIGNVGL